MLVLPAEPAEPHGARLLEHRHDHRGAADLVRLPIAGSPAACCWRPPRRSRCRACWSRSGRCGRRPRTTTTSTMFGMRGPRMHQRPAQRLEELAVQHVAGAVLGHLAGAAGDDVLVALAARLGVVGRAQPVDDGLDLFEDEPVVVERAQRPDVVLVQRVERTALRIHAVGQAVEPGRGLGGIASAEERALRIHRPGADERLPAAIVGAPILPRFLRRNDAHARHQGDEPASGQDDRRAAQQSGEAAQGAGRRLFHGAILLTHRTRGTAWIRRASTTGEEFAVSRGARGGSADVTPRRRPRH